ncbi:restriction endonuclease [Sphingomonas lycopersici]|uniref:Restriction endonuclease n=1 Tax=Sphingomonas lycopersici TaxID=2951807 RepID=A0AA41ZBY2_9SPHN|nr:restriction endonuclease [Sphingomonas lycopersici]MCW6536311.1 restriction endonuclease [Sphingomonas lycopersici]
MHNPDNARSLNLIESLRTLPPSGAESFEHLIRDLLSRATGRRFTIAKSGPQGGIDARTGADPDTIQIGVEAKRYGQGTHLGLDELKSKLRDTAKAHSDLELWILAASREIAEPDAGALRAEGDDLGISVLILDWPQSNEAISSLLLLCAAHPDLLAASIAMTPQIQGLLAATRAHPSYAVQLEQLLKSLTDPGLGYANARSAMAARLVESMASKPAAATSIGRYANLSDPEVVRVDRPALRESITAWWNNMPCSLLALLGDDGMGKTWAVLGWWLDRTLSGTDLPLTLVVPARAVTSTNPGEIIGRALYAAFQIRDAAWWERRARRWCAGAHETRILMLVDGLNERFDAQGWPDIGAQIQLSPWAGSIALIVTDRFDHWRRFAGGFDAVDVRFHEEKVGKFSEPELDSLLGRGGLRRTELDPGLIPLMMVPRLCALAIRHWERLGRSGDITPERLIYEDFRDRIYPDLGDDELRNLIAEMGQAILHGNQAGITVLRRQIGEALAAESGMAIPDSTISAIVSGVWFAQIPGEPHRFKINEDLAPIAIGLALARSLQPATTRHDAERRIIAFVDDLRGLELGVTVIGIAASFATIWPQCSIIARDTLLDAWLSSDNFGQNELRRYTRLIAENPALFLDRAELVWRDLERRDDDRDINLAGLVNAAEAYPAVLDAFAARAVPWFAETYPWKSSSNGDDLDERLTLPAIHARIEEWNLARGEILPALKLVEFTDEDAGALGLAIMLIRAISYLPRKPFAPALGIYAVATTITHRVHYQRESFEWLLRANTIDAAEASVALVEQANAIRDVGRPAATYAADLLLDALAALAPGARPSTQIEYRLPWPESQRTTVQDGIVHWHHEPASMERGWGEAALFYAPSLVRFATDPEATLADESVALLRSAFEDAIDCIPDQSLELQKGVEAVLARWAPDLLARYFGRIENIDGGAQLNRAVKGWTRSWIAHQPETTIGIECAFQAARRASAATGGRLNPELTMLALAEADAAAQYSVFKNMPEGTIWPEGYDSLLAKPEAAQFSELEEILAPDQPPKHLVAWLALLSHSDLRAMPPRFNAVTRLFEHENLDVRVAALQLAGTDADRELADALRDIGWKAEGKEGVEPVYGSAALARAQPMPGEGRVARIIPLAYGTLAEQWPGEEPFFNAFAQNVRDTIALEINPPRTGRAFGHSFNNAGAYARLIAERATEVEDWLRPLIDRGDVSLHDILFGGEQAVVRSCKALMSAGRPISATIWRILLQSIKSGNVASDEILLMPFLVGKNSVSDSLRAECLDAINIDSKIEYISIGLQHRGELEWLIDFIDWRICRSTLDAGKALVLAGALDSNHQADHLWSKIDAMDFPAWLREVRKVARGCYKTNAKAKIWLARFCQAREPVDAFMAFELFRACVERATRLWATDLVDEGRLHLARRQADHWAVNLPALNHEAKAVAKRGEDRLAYTRIPRDRLAPWR